MLRYNQTYSALKQYLSHHYFLISRLDWGKVGIKNFFFWVAKIFILFGKQRSRKYKWAKQHEFLHLIMKYKIHLLFLYLHTHFSSKSSQQQHCNFAKGVGPSINGRVSVGVIKEGVLGSSKYSIKIAVYIKLKCMNCKKMYQE